MANAAVGHDGHFTANGCPDFSNGLQLRYTGACFQPCATPAAGTYAHFHRVNTRVAQKAGAVASRDIAADQQQVVKALAQLAKGVAHDV